MALIPILGFSFSTATFLFAIQLPLKSRLYAWPFLTSSALLSLYTSSYLPQIQGIPALWGLFQCIWMHDATSLFFFEQFKLPSGTRKERWIYAYKIWCDPQRRIDWSNLPQCIRKGSTLPLHRVGFVLRRVAKLVFCWALQLYVVGSIPMYFHLTSMDLAPSREGYIRRLLIPQFGPPITLRESKIRLFMSYYWIWMSYLMLDTCHIILSIFFVAVVRIDEPEEWRPLFGSPLQAYTIGRFWTRFWHRLTAPSCVASGHQITRNLLNMRPGSRGEKICIAFWTFLISGGSHAIAEWLAGEMAIPWKEFKFFLANFAFGLLELQAAKLVKRFFKVQGKSQYVKVLQSNVVERLVGYAWVLGFFFWIAPKWHYAKLYDAAKEAEYLAMLKVLGL
jgi:hypothetical protein